MVNVVLTPDKVFSWGPCAEYTIEKLRELGEPSITLDDIFRLDIAPKDRRWIIQMVLRDPDFDLSAEDRETLRVQLRDSQLFRNM
jgi:hypothetical protein